MQTNGIISCISQNKYRIINKAGEGGQGSIWFVESCDANRTQYMLKIINEKNSELRKRKITNIMSLYRKRKEFFSSFESKPFEYALPIDVYNDGGSFGYIMKVACGVTINQMMLQHEFDNMDIDDRIRMVLRISQAIAWLQRMGYCYMDISHNNVFYDSTSDYVSIIDCDNIASNTASKQGKKRFVQGSSFFIAPEVAFGLEYPNIDSDNFSMASMFYIIMTSCTDSPYHGKALYTKTLKPANMLLAAEYTQDDPSYGDDWLVFVHHPHDKRNTIDLSIFKDVEARKRQQLVVDNWKKIPTEIQKLFVEAFANPLSPTSYSARPNASKWENVISSLISKSTIKSPIQSDRAKIEVVFPNGKKTLIEDIVGEILASNIIVGMKGCFGCIVKDGNNYLFFSRSCYMQKVETGAGIQILKNGKSVLIESDMRIYYLALIIPHYERYFTVSTFLFGVLMVDICVKYKKGLFLQ